MRLRRQAAVCAFLFLGASAIFAQFPPPTDFGSVAIHPSSPSTQTLTFHFSGLGAAPGFSLAYGIDFTIGSPSCNGSWTICTLAVNFAPDYPGLRQDAVMVRDANGNFLGSAFLHGIGLGPQVAFVPGVISTVAGQNSSFSSVSRSIAVDPAGNLYIADPYTSVVRKIAANTGAVTVIAGNGSSGYSGDGGPATNAELRSPVGLALDAAGNLYIADSFANVIRLVNAGSGTITTIAGNGSQNFGLTNPGDGGPATSAQLSEPSAIAVDAPGNVYIADTGDNVIRKVTASTGVITKLAGTYPPIPGLQGGYSGDGGPAASAQLNQPVGLAIDPAGNLYIADTGNARVREVYASNGTIVTIAGNGTNGNSGDGGLAVDAEVSPNEVTLDPAQNLYITDANHSVIRRVDAATGIILTVAGNGNNNSPPGDGGPATQGGLGSPTDTVIDNAGNLYIGSSSAATVRKITAAAAPMVFSSTDVGAPTSEQILTLVNSGSSPLNISSIAFTGDNPGDFLQTNTCAAAIAPGEDCTISVSFVPNAGAAASANLAITDDAVNSPQTTAVTGAGIAQTQISLSSDELNFGSQNVGFVSSAQTVTLMNSGSTALSISGISITGENAADFAQTNNCGAGIAPTANCTISATFKPTLTGNRSAYLTINDAATGSPHTVALTGIGGSGASSCIVGLFSANPNPAISYGGAAAASVLVDANCAYDVRAGSPSGTLLGSGSGEGTFATGNTGTNGTVFFLQRAGTTISSGTLAAFTLGVNILAASSYDFGQVAVGSSGSPQTVTLQFQQVSPQPAIMLQYGIDFSLGTPSCSGTGTVTCTVAVTFTPTAACARRDGITVQDSFGHTLATVLLHGIGTAPQVTVVPGALTSVSVNGLSFSEPNTLTLDTQGNLYFSDSFNQAVYKIDHNTGNATLIAGTPGNSGYSGDGGSAINAKLNNPAGLAIDGAGNVYIADSGNNVIRRVSAATGLIVTVAGNGTAGSSGDNGPAISAELSNPYRIALSETGDLYITEPASNVIRKVAGATGTITTVSTQQTISSPNGIAVDETGNLYVTEVNSVVRVNTDGSVTALAGGGANSNANYQGAPTGAQFFSLGDIALDAAGDVYFVDFGTETIRVIYNALGNLQTIAGGGSNVFFGQTGVPATSVSFPFLTGIAVDPSGNIYLNSFTSSFLKITATGAPVTMPSTNIGQTSGAQSATILNTGNANLSLSGLSLSGPNTADFTQTNNCENLLAPSSPCTVTITFAPQATGSRTASVTISDNASGSPQNIPLNGTGLTAQQAVLSPTSLTFNQVFGTSSAQTVTLSNPGTATLHITSIAAGYPGSGFSQSNNCGAALVAGAQCTITVTFSAPQPYTTYTSLAVNDDASDSPQTVTLSGFGGTTAQPTLNRTSLLFSNQGVAVASGPQSFTVTNTTSGTVTGLQFSISGTNAAEFSETNTCGTSLNAGASCTVSVTFTPAALGVRTATLTLSDASPGSAQTVTLVGIGAPPQVTVFIDAPGAQTGPYLGLATFHGWAISNSAAITSITVLIDEAPVGTTQDTNARPDVCATYPGTVGCPNVGWAFNYDTTLLPNGTHTLEIRADSANGQHAVASSSFTVANWAPASADPMHINIDVPSAQSGPFSGTAHFGGWAIDDIAAIAQVSIAIDGVSYGNATYGGGRPDVCTAYPNRPGCPNVGWNFQVDTTGLADGTHMLSVTGTSTGGAQTTVSTTFTVANFTASNPIHLNIDTPNAQSAPFSGVAHFGGWALDDSDSISQVTVEIDGVGNIPGVPTTATYGGVRTDVCAVYPGRANCPNVGWDVSADTALLANGTHTLIVKAVTAHGQQGTAQASFTVFNPVPVNGTRINIDQPSTGSPVVGVTQFFGWAINSSLALNSISISVDGTQYGFATATDRPDVCAAFPGTANCPQVGWSFTLDTTQLADGPHTLTVTAGRAGEFFIAGAASTSASFNVANWTTNNPMRVNIDNPASQATLKGVTPIGGWAIDDFAAITGVSISVDGVAIGSATYGGGRPDVCNAFPNRQGCPNVGWNYLLDTTVLADGAHTLDVTASSSGGQHTTVSTTFKVANLSGSALRIWIDTPGSQNPTLSGATPIGGWAIDDNAAISSVVVAVDGVTVAPATYGGSRPDVCNAFPNRQGCPNVGWDYSLDTTQFANGAHTLDITVTAANGDKATKSAAFMVSN